MIAVGRGYDTRACRIRDNTVARMMARLKAATVPAAVGELRATGAFTYAVTINVEGAGEPVPLFVEDGHVRFDGSCDRIAVRFDGSCDRIAVRFDGSCDRIAVRFDGSCDRIAVRKNRATFDWLVAFAVTMREQAKAAAKRQGRLMASHQERAEKDADDARRMKLLNEQAPQLLADVAHYLSSRHDDDAMALFKRCANHVDGTALKDAKARDHEVNGVPRTMGPYASYKFDVRTKCEVLRREAVAAGLPTLALAMAALSQVDPAVSQDFFADNCVRARETTPNDVERDIIARAVEVFRGAQPGCVSYEAAQVLANG